METKYSMNNLKTLVGSSTSMSQVVAKLGLKPSGGNWHNVSKYVKDYGIDITHFTKEKHTKEKLATIVAASVSISEVMKALGLKPGGGTQSFITKKIRKHQIDTSHFLGQRANSGSRHKGSPKRRSWQETLVKKNSGNKENGYILREALIASGRPYRCEAEGCVIADQWLGKKIRLQVHHEDGNWLNNEPSNLEFHCPNCHSQTPNYCTGNRRTK